MEGTMNTAQNKTMDEIIDDMNALWCKTSKIWRDLKNLNEKEFAGDGDDVTDKLPSMTEALKLREENEKLKEENKELEEEYNSNIKDWKKSLIEIDELKSDIDELKSDNEKLRYGMEVGVDTILKNLNESQAEKIRKLIKENEKLKEEIICLKSDSYNEVSQSQYDDMKEDYEAEIKKLKEENKEWRKVCEDFDTPGEVSVMIDDMKDNIKELQDEIPDKKGKKLSKKDKEVLKGLIISADDEHPEYDSSQTTGILTPAEKKLLRRLLK